MIRELSPELAKVARDELNENPKTMSADLQLLKEWICKQPHLKARTDDQWLIAILRGCKFSLERVKKKLDLYYTLRTTAPDLTLRIKPTDPKFIEFFRLGHLITDDQWLIAILRGCKFSLERVKKKLDLYYTLRTTAPDLTLRIKPTDPKFIEFFRLGTCLILPKIEDKLMPRVIMIRAGLYNPSTHNVADVMCMLYYLVQILVVEDDVATVLGTKIVVDYEGVTMNHFAQAPPILKKMVAVAQDSMPLRLKGSHHINLPSGIEKIFTLISGFLNEKAKQRLKIHKSQAELMEHIPREILPAEYGGDGGTVAKIIEYWVSKFKEYQPWLKVEERLGTDESKRIGPPISEDLMSEGSFRKLDID